MSIPGENEPDVPRILEARALMSRCKLKAVLEIGLYLRWVQDSLAAHISGKPLPPMTKPRIGKDRNLNDFSELVVPDDL